MIHVAPLFLEACSKIMGHDWTSNQVLVIQLLLELLRQIEEKIKEAMSLYDLNFLIVAHCYMVVSYVIPLRGPY